MSERKSSLAPLLIVLFCGLLFSAVAFWCFHWWQSAPEPVDETMVLRDGISVLAPTPDWGDLDRYQKTITRENFATVLEKVYSQGPAYKSAVKFGDGHVDIRTADKPYRLVFAPSPTSDPPHRYWRGAAQMALTDADAKERPLDGIKIAIDPGHIGGSWAKMEERWYQIDGKGTEVKEGELTLLTAQILAPMLAELGAEVSLIRTEHEPLTSKRPEDLLELAEESLVATNQPTKGTKRKSEKMFYTWSEIRSRAERINEEVKPDLALCMHYNAEGWGNPAEPKLTNRNHLHLLINGTYSNYEFSLHDQRLDLMKRILQRIHPEELAVSSAVADAVANETGLRPYLYTKPTAKRVSDNRYVWARNLMANRIYMCPVVFLEPYVMNSHEVYERIGAGDYEGEKVIAGKMRKSIFREYAHGVANGLAEYYRTSRPRAKEGSKQP